MSHSSSAPQRGRCILSLAPIGALLFSVVVFFWLAPASAQAAGEPCHATPNDGTTVYSSLNAHAVQQAVDAAPIGGHVKVAGRCVGVEARASTSQSTYISKTLTLSGGYTLTNWTTSNPVVNPTVIDANGGGRVLFVTNVPLTVQNITLQRGNIGSGGIFCPSAGCGGGVWADGALTLSNVHVLSNTANSQGGGVHVSGGVIAVNSRFENNRNMSDFGGGLYAGSTLWMTNTRFISNTGIGFGGGAYVDGVVTAVNSRFENNHSTFSTGGGLFTQSTLWLTNTHFISNTAFWAGGGVSASGAVTAANSRFENNHTTFNQGGGLIAGSTLQLTNTHFLNNTASDGGGGAYAGGAVTAVQSRFENNRSVSNNGGGLYASSTVQLTNTQFLRNRANNGGGIYLTSFGTATERLVNVLLAGNRASGSGDAIYAFHSGGDDTLTILYTTIASPTLTGGAAVYVNAGTVRITDTIIVSHTTGIQRNGGTVTQDHNLFFGNTNNTVGAVGGGANSVVGAPAFVNPTADDYRLTATSAAVNIGVNVGVTSDFFGDPRPLGGGFDAGYDELFTTIPCSATPNDGATVYSSLNAHAVQQAVDAAPIGGHVKVAGRCVGVEARASTSQSVYISKTLTLSGGYTLTNWTTSNPVANPTVIDANGSGRVLFVTNVPLTVQNITLQRGAIGGSGTVCPGAGCGGGVWAEGALTLSNVQVLSNTARYDGGGARVNGAVIAVNSRFQNNTSTDDRGGGLDTGATLSLTNTWFLSNTSLFSGGGAFVLGAARVVDSRFENNRTRSVEGDGGGLRVNASLNLTNTDFLSNTGRGQGGGANASGPATVVNSRFEYNRSLIGSGGGLFGASTVDLSASVFLGNSAAQGGGGATVVHASGGVSRIVNSLFARNHSGSGRGDALGLISPSRSGTVEVLFTTISSPTVSGGSAIEVDGNGVVVITDTIVTSHTVGIRQTGSTVNQYYTLFFGNVDDVAGTVGGGTGSLVGDPAFLDPTSDDYRLTPTSAAIDAGVDVGVYTDFEGEARPQGSGFDVGYDELLTPPGTIVVRKVVVGAPPADVWQFMGPTGAFTLPAVGGAAVFTPVVVGDHTISETPKQYYAAVSACSNGAIGGDSVNVTVGSDQTITCTFTNTRTIGLITIIKDSTPKGSQNFNFSAGPPTPISGVGNEGGALSAFILDDAAPSDNDIYPKQRSFLLPNGVYTFGEAPPSNWFLKAIECVAGNGSSFVVTLPNVAITLGGGDVTCTFRNQLSVTIQTLKYRDTNGNGVRNSGEPVLAGWQITATLQPTGTPTYGPLTTNSLGRANFNFIPAGTYKVCETLTGGWVNTQPGGGSPCYTLTLSPGQTASVNFGNRQLVAAAEDSVELAPFSPHAGVTISDGDPNALDGYTVDWAAWVDALLLTPAEEPLDAPEEGEATNRLYLPVVVR